ncbi:MAG: porin [Puniceicoccaceae bacterium]
MLRLRYALLAATLVTSTWLYANPQQSLADLLVKKGVITQAEASGISPSGVVQSGLVNLLIEKGVISAAEADSLAASAPAPAPAPIASAPASAPKQFTLAKDKLVTGLTISGRIQGQMDVLSTDYDNASDPGSETNLFMRRIYLGASAKFADNLSGTVNANFAKTSGTGKIEKAVIEYGMGDYHTLIAGYQKTPMGFEETTSSSKIAAVERSVGTRYFTEQLDLGARHTGLFLEGEYDGGMYFTIAATNPVQGAVSSSSSTDKIAIWANIGWEGDVGEGTLNTGAGYARVPETLSSGNTDSIWNLYANYNAGKFNILAELIGADLEGAGYMGDASPIAFTLLPSFKVSDDIEFVARYSQVDADNGIGADISSTFRRAPENGSAKYNDVQAYYLGGNWYIRGNTLKLSAGYEWAKFEDNLSGSQGDADVSGFRTRVQLLF